MQKVTNCPIQCASKVFIEDENNPKDQHMVNISNSLMLLRKLFTMCGTTLDLDKADEAEIKEAVRPRQRQVFFDLASKKLLELNLQTTDFQNLQITNVQFTLSKN